MAKAKRPRPPKATPLSQRGKVKRRRQEQDDLLPEADQGDAFHASDDEPGTGSDEDSGNESAEETAEAKRLRLGDRQQPATCN